MSFRLESELQKAKCSILNENVEQKIFAKVIDSAGLDENKLTPSICSGANKCHKSDCEFLTKNGVAYSHKIKWA